MSLEGRDINDSAIIDSTRKARNDKGQTQFSIDLPSGREITSEWLSEDNVKKALVPWIEAVRTNMIADAEEVRAQARRTAAMQPKQPAPPALVSPSGDVLTAELPQSLAHNPQRSTGAFSSIPTTSVDRYSADQTPASTASPDEFARQGVIQARKDAEYWQNVTAGAMEKWREAQANAEKWERILAAVSGGVVLNGIQGASTSASSAGTDSTGNTRKRGRPVGSRNKRVPDSGTTDDVRAGSPGV